MFYVILGLGEQKSIFRSICVHFKIIFHTNLKKIAFTEGTPRLIKSFPCAENFFLSLTDDIFVICNLKVIKNQRNTYHKMHFDQKLLTKVLGTYLRLYPLNVGGKIHYTTNKAKAINTDLLVFIKLGSCNILFLGTLKFWWHFSFSDISFLVTFQFRWYFSFGNIYIWWHFSFSENFSFDDISVLVTF